MLNAAVMVRRKKADVLTQLPAKRRHQVSFKIIEPLSYHCKLAVAVMT